jgi:predicted nucleic acid-binding protein
VKLVIREAETEALERSIAERVIVTSELSLVEVVRAVKVARPDPERIAEAERLLASLDLAAISRPLLHRAAVLASSELRSLDAIHLATAERLGASEIVTYDRRLAAAAERLGMSVLAPGA